MNGQEMVNELIKREIEKLEKVQKRFIATAEQARKIWNENSDKGFEVEKKIRELRGQLK
nr:MAG TPA: hypothetical protein [Caudoviricetes sp.]